MQTSRAHVSQIQKSHMLKYLAKNRRLANCQFSTSFSVRDAQKEWESLSLFLNKLPGRGSNKKWKQWRKTWHDLKSKTKIKFLQGMNYDDFTVEEKFILKIIGKFDDNELPNNEVLIESRYESGIDGDDPSTNKNEDTELTEDPATYRKEDTELTEDPTACKKEEEELTEESKSYVSYHDEKLRYMRERVMAIKRTAMMDKQILDELQKIASVYFSDSLI